MEKIKIKIWEKRRARVQKYRDWDFIEKGEVIFTQSDLEQLALEKFRSTNEQKPEQNIFAEIEQAKKT